MQTASKESVRVESVPDRRQRQGGGSALAFQLEQVDSPLWGVGGSSHRWADQEVHAGGSVVLFLVLCLRGYRAGCW